MTAPDFLTEVSAKRISIGDRLWQAWPILTAKFNIFSDRADDAELFGTFLRDAQQGTATDPEGS